MVHACVVDACVARDGEEPRAVNVMPEYNVAFPPVPNAASTTLTQEDVFVTHFTPEMIAHKVKNANTFIMKYYIVLHNIVNLTLFMNYSGMFVGLWTAWRLC